VSEGDSVLSLSAKVEQKGERALLSIASASFDLGPRKWTLSKPGELEIGKGWIRSHGLSVRSASGGWTIRGGVDSLGVMDLRVDLMDGDLGLLPHLGIGPTDLEGTLEGHVALQGRRENPDLSIDVKGKRLTGFGRRVERLRLLTTVHGSEVALDSLQVLSPQGELYLSGALELLKDDALQWLTQNPEGWRELLGPAKPNLTLAFHDLNGRYWMEPQAKDENLGRTTAALSIQGTLERPRIQGEAQITNLVSGGGSLVFPTLRSRVESDGGSLKLSHGIILTPDPWLRFNVALPLRLSAVHAPQWAGSEGVEVELTSDGEVELRRVGSILPMLSEISGKAELLYRARGSMDHPQIEGYLRVHDGIAQLEGSLERLRDIEIDAPIRDGVMKIQKFTAHEGLKGTVSATGEVKFEGLLPDDIQMDIEADRFLFASILHLRALLRTNDLHMSLKRPAPHLSRRPYFSGTIDVIKARYTGEFENKGSGEVLGATTTPSWLANLHLRAPRTARVQNRTAELVLDGDGDLVRDLDGLHFYGQVEITQGRVPIFNNDFNIERGTLDYSRARGLEPSVDIVAKTRVRDFRYEGSNSADLEEITVYLTGTFSNLHTRFESESGYDEERIIRLLAGISEEPGRSALADTGFKAGLNFIERSIAQEIHGIDTLDIETESASISEAQRMRVAVGKYLSPDLYLRYSQGVSITERALFLEYQMNRRLRLSSEFGTGLQSGAPTTTFNVDLKYRVEY
jgi:autotransporter translocation and assembly factor TamB